MLVLGFAIDRQIAFLLGFNLEKQYLIIFYLEAPKHLELSQEIFVDVHKLILSHAIGLCLWHICYKASHVTSKGRI